MNTILKQLIEDLLEAPDKEKFSDLLKNYLEEFDELEYKENYNKFDIIAKHILAMANTCNSLIILGVKENDDELEPIGIELKDKTDIKNKNFVETISEKVSYRF